MQRIQGVTFSHLLVGRALTAGRFSKFLDGLRVIHSSNGIATRHVELPPSLEARISSLRPTDALPANVYANYREKLSERYYQYPMIYEALGDDHLTLATRLIDFLGDFELDGRASYSEVIHGTFNSSTAM